MDKTEKLTLRECLLGDRAFYRHVLLVVLPIIVQNTLTNVVSLLDNVMVGQVGTLPMSGVAVVGQLLFVYNLAIWGSTSGAGIFGAQFYGRGDMDGVRHTFRFKLLVSTAITAAAIMLFLAAGPALIGAYISADTSPADAAATLDYAWGYLRIMLVGLVPFGLTQCYAGTLRESGQTVLLAGLISEQSRQQGRRVALILSGANIDRQLYAWVLADGAGTAAQPH